MKPRAAVNLINVAWLIAFTAALAMDRRIAMIVHDNHIDRNFRNTWLAEIIKFPGTFWFAIALAAVFFFSRYLNIRQSIFLLLASASSASNSIVKWVVGRTRPYKLPASILNQPLPFKLQPFRGGITGLFQQKDLSFVSGHACTAVAFAVAMIIFKPKLWPIWLAIALAVSLERVLENAHYASDVVGGWKLGFIGVLIVWRYCRVWIKATPSGPGSMKVS